MVEHVKEECPKLKIAYVRADEKTGEFAISKFKLTAATLTDILNKKVSLGEVSFTFAQLDGDGLEEFWQKHGGHYQYCIKPKLR